MLIDNLGDSLRDIINNTYPSLLENIRNTFFQHRTILASTNDIVYEFNEYIMSLISNEAKTYLSLDALCVLNK